MALPARVHRPGQRQALRVVLPAWANWRPCLPCWRKGNRGTSGQCAKASGCCRSKLVAGIVLNPHGARSFSRLIMSSEPSEGVFFVLRLPKGWQLCTCRHDEYGPLGLPDFWVEALGPFLN